jgi:hypothetical protein
MLDTTKLDAIKTRSQLVADDVAALLRARHPLLWVVTREESRAERYLFEAAASAGYVTHFWDVAAGFTELNGERSPGTDIGSRDPGEALNAIRERAIQGGASRAVWVMRDLPAWLNGPAGATTLRQVCNLARLRPSMAKERAQAIIVLTSSGEVPPELANHCTVIDWPLPDRAEIAGRLDALIEQYQLNLNGTRDAAIDAAIGLTDDMAASCYGKSLVQTKTIDPALIAKEKKRVIAQERVLEWFDPLPNGLDAVGGLDVLKAWLWARKAAYSRKARDYGLPAPKGVLLVGIPGCGKSLTAKALATMLGVPLLRFDLGALKSKFVGESEANIRKAISVIEAIGRCVVWLDEIEKALAGATQGAADGGVSSDALGTILSWMQDRQGEAFIVATCNDVTALPPELLRKGRFDELFFVDLPNTTERGQIVWATLRNFKRDPNTLDCGAVADATAGFTGSEIAALVPDAMFAAFADGEREIVTKDLIAAAASITPLSKTAETKITGLREWAKGRARLATTPQVQDQRQAGRVLDL